MNVEEFDTALSDLETRMDRLRALYENWFRGYEKMEPGVARKDVERRVYGLRKELPRNTALRFRYHQLFQRYTTLATYWQRTARQIEEGTYRRQLQRLKRRRDDDTVRTLAPPRKEGSDSSAPPPAFELDLDETLDVRSLLDDVDLDRVASALEVTLPTPAQQPVAKASAELAAHVRGASGRVPAAAAIAPSAKPSDAPEAATLPPVSAQPAPAAAASAAAAKRFARPSMETPAAAPIGVGRGSQRPPPAMAPANDVTPEARPAVPKPPAIPAAARAPATGAMPMPPPPPPSAAARTGGTGAFGIPSPPGRVPAPPPKPAVPPPVGAAPAAARPMPPVRPSMPSAGAAASPPGASATAQAVAGSAPAARPGAPMSNGPAVPATNPTTSSGGSAKPAASPARPPQPAARPPQPAAPARAEAGLDEQRMRRIYEEYAAAKRKNNEGDVRYETLAGSIQKMLPDLHKRHAGKQIDFEVVLKDGRVGLKPKAT